MKVFEQEDSISAQRRTLEATEKVVEMIESKLAMRAR